MTLIDRQKKLEEDANDFSYTRLMNQINKRIEMGQADELTEGRVILLHSIDKLSVKLKEYFEADIRGRMKAIRDAVGCEFKDDTKDLAYIIIVSLVRNISRSSHIPLTQMIGSLNRAIKDSISMRRLYNSESNFGVYVDKRFANRSEEFRTREKLKVARKQEKLKDYELDKETAYIGATLIDLVIKSGINIIEKKEVKNGRHSAIHLTYTEECYRMVLQSRERLLNEYRKYPIFVAPPVPWERFRGSGGYYRNEVYKIPLIKARKANSNYLEQYFEKADVQGLYDVLNVIQATPWKINRKVFDVMNQVFKENIVDESCPKANPYLVGKLPYNGHLEPEDFVNIHSFGQVHTEGELKGRFVELDDYLKYKEAIENQRDLILANQGKALMHNLVMLNAEEYIGEEAIYFSYQYDFRGRIYPIQQHLQPQGKGEVKSLLHFAQGVKIETEKNLKWFLIHGANCYGYDKDPYDVRVEKIQSKQEEVLLVASSPLKFREFWKDADDPYMYLAWCFEYAEYLTNPDTFVSHLPIALDAVCSGIQIYSGLLRDANGAKAVCVLNDYEVVEVSDDYELGQGEKWYTEDGIQ